MKSLRLSLFFVLGIILVITDSCVMPNQYSGVAPGMWRATLQLDGRKSVRKEKGEMIKKSEKVVYEEVTEGELPFTFEVIYTDADHFYIEIINGDERIKVEDVTWGRKKYKAQDTIRIDFPVYETYIIARYEANVMEGHWYVPAKGDYSIPFVAKHGKDHRFTNLRKEPTFEANGNWATTFFEEDSSSYTGIGEFKQKDNYLTGTFRTETGDYRYLGGTVQANKLYLSCFDGAHAFLFEAKYLEDGTLSGYFRSGNHYTATWDARKDDNFKLTDPNELTFLKEGYDKIAFTFPDLEGNQVSISDEKYKGKVKIVQIFGTWCPNCAEETKYLSNYYNNLKDENLAIVSLAYERRTEFEQAAKVVGTWKDRFDVNFDVLIAGNSSKIDAAKTLPMLNKIISFPTLIFIDQNDKVRKIHTGFNGAATSQYEAFTKEFESFVAELLAEVS